MGGTNSQKEVILCSAKIITDPQIKVAGPLLQCEPSSNLPERVALNPWVEKCWVGPFIALVCCLICVSHPAQPVAAALMQEPEGIKPHPTL